MAGSIKLTEVDIAWAGDSLERLNVGLARVVVGQKLACKQLVACLLAGGHVLLEGVPGVAKTILARTMAQLLDLRFGRVQFTPDLLPGDLTGTVIYDPLERRFVRQSGPVFTQILLADEINRAPAKVQSALLEAMEEGQVTVGLETTPLPDPFWVVATQNPVELEGTFPLPEAQQDRFLARVTVPYPSLDDEREIAERGPVRASLSQLIPALSADSLKRLRSMTQQVHVSSPVRDYAVDLARATRRGESGAIAEVAHQLRLGVGPRGPLALLALGRAWALLCGRNHVRPDDIQSVALAALGHRIIPDYSTQAKGITNVALVNRLLDLVAVP